LVTFKNLKFVNHWIWKCSYLPIEFPLDNRKNNTQKLHTNLLLVARKMNTTKCNLM